jgi:hypothetical protein
MQKWRRDEERTEGQARQIFGICCSLSDREVAAEKIAGTGSACDPAISKICFLGLAAEGAELIH